MSKSNIARHYCNLAIIICRESSRVVFIPFEKADLGTWSEKIDDTELLTILKVAGDAVYLFIKLAKSFNSETLRTAIYEKIKAKFKDSELSVSVRVKRTYTILLAFTLLVCRYRCMLFRIILTLVQLAESSTVGPSEDEVWEFFSKKMIPVIRAWQLEPTTTETSCNCENPKDVINKAMMKIIDDLECEETNKAQVSKLPLIYNFEMCGGVFCRCFKSSILQFIMQTGRRPSLLLLIP